MTSDAEIARNPHQPEGWWRNDIESSLLHELDAVALATNVMVFLGRDTRWECNSAGGILRVEAPLPEAVAAEGILGG